MLTTFLFSCIYRLYKERLSQVDAKLQEVIAGKAPEYLEPLAALQENMQIRTKVAGRMLFIGCESGITLSRRRGKCQLVPCLQAMQRCQKR